MLKTNLPGLLNIAIKAALHGGAEILSVYEKADFKVETKADDSPLTLADRLSHQAIVDLISKESPDIPVMSEEGADVPFSKRDEWREYWLVDPLDGTKEFIKRNGEFTVNIALIDGNRPVIGVIYIPVSDVLYYASSVTGAHKRKKASELPESEWSRDVDRLPIAAGPGPSTIRVVASRSHNSEETEDFIDSLRERYSVVETVASGSSIKFCLVAEGVAEVYPRFGTTMEWDTAAGHCIATEAGCSVQRREGGPLVYNKQDLRNPQFVVERDNA